MELRVLDMISKDLGGGGKRLPTIGYQLTTQDADLLEAVLSVGYRHFLFTPDLTAVLAETLQEYAADDDIFLTLRVPVHLEGQTGAQHVVQGALRTLNIPAIDMVLLYDNQPDSDLDKQEKGYVWKARWMELETLYQQGLVRNLGLYSGSAEDVQRVVARAKHKPSIVYLPDVDTCRVPSDSSRRDVISCCAGLDLQVAVALDADVTRNGRKPPFCTLKSLCRTMMECGYSMAVSSTSEQHVVNASEVFDQWVSVPQRAAILKKLGFK